MRTSSDPAALFTKKWYEITHQTVVTWPRSTMVNVSSRYLVPFCLDRRTNLEKFQFPVKKVFWPVRYNWVINIDLQQKYHHTIPKKSLVGRLPRVICCVSAKHCDYPFKITSCAVTTPTVRFIEKLCLCKGRRYQNHQR